MAMHFYIIKLHLKKTYDFIVAKASSVGNLAPGVCFSAKKEMAPEAVANLKLLP